MASYKQLTDQLAKIQIQVATAREKEVSATIAWIKEKIMEYEITAEELGFSSRARGGATRKSAAPPKYRHPKTGQTWSGRGRAPMWIGKNRDRFLIKK